MRRSQKLMEEKEEKLTAFQERYIKGATLVFEYHENTGARYYIPKDSIIELIEDEDEATANNTELDTNSGESKNKDLNESKTAPDSDNSVVKKEENDNIKVESEDTKMDITDVSIKDSSPTRENTPSATASPAPKKKKKFGFCELLISFVLVHNQEALDKFDKEEAIRKAEEEKTKVKEEEGEKEKADASKRPKKRRKTHKWGPSRRSTRSSSKNEEEDDKKDGDYVDVEDKNASLKIRPTPLYSTSTIKLYEIPVRFGELIRNSANDPEEVRQKMSQIFATGVRLNQQHIWHQLDGKKDELLAENLRFNLNRLDYLNGGGKLKGKALLKRVAERTGSEAEIVIKRPKN
ncbi:unnamed protein product [[Candida] boidinii]|nr:unnamed protein product [[Candida] boidinii]